jgi:hypothetical protein
VARTSYIYLIFIHRRRKPVFRLLFLLLKIYLRFLKRLVSILLLALLLYNAFGYYLLFAYEREQQRVVVLQDMPESAFQVLKFNVAVYTSVANTPFEYVNEDLTVENKTYHIVKKRIQNDTLNLCYLHNFRQDELRKNLNDIVESQTLNNTNTKETPVKQLLKSFLKENITNDIYVLVDCCPEIVPEFSQINVAPPQALLSVYLSVFSPPPEVV